jgi:hypothetical protein
MNPRDGIGKLKVRLVQSPNGWYWVISTLVGGKTVAMGKLCKTRDSARVAVRNAIRSISRAQEAGEILWE